MLKNEKKHYNIYYLKCCNTISCFFQFHYIFKKEKVLRKKFDIATFLIELGENFLFSQKEKALYVVLR